MEDLKPIKHLFYTYRNGMLADTLRRAGMPYKVIFGLQLPQLGEIAVYALSQTEGHPAAAHSLARKLWLDKDVRESRLLATWLFNPEDVSLESALELTRSLQTREEADMLAFRLLRRLPGAAEIKTAIDSDPAHPFPYAAEALARFL